MPINRTSRILKLLKEKKIYKKNHILIIHRERNTEDNFSDFLKIFSKKLWKIK